MLLSAVAQLIVDLDFPNRVAALVAKHAIRPQQLVLEITEDALLSDLPTARTEIAAGIASAPDSRSGLASTTTGDGGSTTVLVFTSTPAPAQILGGAHNPLTQFEVPSITQDVTLTVRGDGVARVVLLCALPHLLLSFFSILLLCQLLLQRPDLLRCRRAFLCMPLHRLQHHGNSQQVPPSRTTLDSLLKCSGSLLSCHL